MGGWVPSPVRVVGGKGKRREVAVAHCSCSQGGFSIATADAYDEHYKTNTSHSWATSCGACGVVKHCEAWMLCHIRLGWWWWGGKCVGCTSAAHSTHPTTQIQPGVASTLLKRRGRPEGWTLGSTSEMRQYRLLITVSSTVEWLNHDDNAE